MAVAVYVAVCRWCIDFTHLFFCVHRYDRPEFLSHLADLEAAGAPSATAVGTSSTADVFGVKDWRTSASTSQQVRVSECVHVCVFPHHGGAYRPMVVMCVVEPLCVSAVCVLRVAFVNPLM
jgi:hypothetical protein